MAADGPPEVVWQAMQAGAVMVSEPFANRFDLPKSGGQVTLLTPAGPRTFPVAAIYYDYASSQGTVMMALPLYQALWEDDATTALALRLAPGADPDQITARAADALAPVQSLIVQPNQALRDEALVVFDRTFAITGALQLLATLVAFIGVLSALLSLMLDKQRELGILRAVGLTGRQLWRLVSLETGLMGAVAGLLAMPTGSGAGADPDLHHQPAQLRLDVAASVVAGAVHPGADRRGRCSAAGRHLPGLSHDTDGDVGCDEVRMKREA